MRNPSLVLSSCLALAVVAACSDGTAPTETSPIREATVTRGTPRPDSILPKLDSVAIGDSIQFHQKLTDNITDWIGQNCTWKISDTTVASLRNWGSGDMHNGSSATVKGKKTGTVTVTVTTQFGTSKSVSLRVVSTSNQTPPPPPPNGTSIVPGQSIQAAVNSHGGGTTFILQAGIHRLQTVTPKSGDSFIGATGAIMSGARLLTTWTKSGNYWKVTGQTQQGNSSTGQCASGYSGCVYPEDLFINNVMLQHVTSLSSLGAGKWYFDYGADAIYIYDNPAGKTVETSVTPYAFTGNASNVTIRNLIIEKFAVVANFGAINAPNAPNWIVDANELRFNHAAAVKMGQAMQLTNNKIHHNALQGIDAWNVANCLVEGNDIGFNNTAHYDPYWSGGGTKFDNVQHLTVRRNNVHDNYGKGLWTDDNAIYIVYEYNTITNNSQQGLSHEVSYDAVIRYNTATGNGFGNPAPLAGAGLSISASQNTEFYGNTVSGNKDGITAREYPRGSGTYGPHIVKNLYVHDNTVNTHSGSTGVLQGTGSNDIYTSGRNNRFSNNTYTLNGMSAPFYWMNATKSSGAWKGYGEDVSGKFTP